MWQKGPHRKRPGHDFRSSDPVESSKERHPPGLRGRQIGLWYARQQKEKRQKQLSQHAGVVHMNAQQLDSAKEAIKASEVSVRKLNDSCSSASSRWNNQTHFSKNDSYWFSCKEDSVETYEYPKLCVENNSVNHKVLQFHKKLQVFRFKDQLLDLIKKNQILVISGETGCGKTTQIPQYILDESIQTGCSCRIVCTQPRRISAVSVAERVAYERGEKCGNGNSCGYQIKLESNFPRRYNSILYCTTGIIIKYLQSDSMLSSITHIVLDEIHERDMQSDFLITIIKDIATKRKGLKVILMSATLNSEVFSSFFDSCPVFHVPGFSYPVTEYLLEDVVKLTSYKPDRAMYNEYNKFLSKLRGRRNSHKMSAEEKHAYLDDIQRFKQTLLQSFPHEACDDICCLDAYLQKKIDYELIIVIIKYIVRNVSNCNDENGAILIFLPGWDDIKQVNSILNDDRFFQPHRYRIIPLHSLMPTAQQKSVFDRPAKGVTKIVLATNIAETSITIDDIVYVIDSGKIKLKNFEHNKNLSTLQARWETKANAKQRSGRAGRVQKGYCFRLYTRLQESKMDEFIIPEIVRTPLDQVCLQIKLLKLGKIQEFLSKVMESPAEDSVNLSLSKLTTLKALDEQENLTPLGYHLAQLPVEPQIGKMLLFGAIFSCISPILTIASCLSFKDPFVVPLGKEKDADRERKNFSCGINSDHLMYARVFDEWRDACQQGFAQDFCWHSYLSSANLRMIKEMRVQFSQYLCDCGFLTSANPEDDNANRNRGDINVVLAVVCSGLYPNIARIVFNKKDSRPPIFSTKSERQVALHQKSINYNTPFCNFKHEWLCFYEKMKTNNINLYDTSEVSPFALLFFGGDLSTFIDEQGHNRITVDGWMQFKAERHIADTVRKLRKQLDKLLEIRIKQPLWEWDRPQLSIIQSIVDLISRS